MSTPKRKLQAKPQPAQMAALELLINAGDHVAAQRRLHALRKSFPEFTPLLRLAWEIEEQMEQHMPATARAYEWHQTAPNSEMALSALSQSARNQGLLALACHAEDRLDALRGIQARKEPSAIDGPFGPVTFQMMVMGDMAQMHTCDNNPKATIALLKDVKHPSGRNNLATAWFMAGEVQKAHDIATATWQDFPDNLYAMGIMVRWRCWLQGLDRCKGFAAPLVATRPQRSDDAIARIETLRFLGDETLAQQAWQDVQGADFWDNADDPQIAAFKRLKDADTSLQEFAGNWLGLGWLNQFKVSAQSLKDDGANEFPPQVSQKLLSLGAHTDYLSRALVLGDALTKSISLSIIKKRSLLSDSSAQAAQTVLLGLLKQPQGTDEQRVELLQWLVEKGLVSQTEPTDVWLHGKLQPVRSSKITLTDAALEPLFAVQEDPRYSDFLDYCHQKRFQQALEVAQQLCRDFPDDPPVWSNLATVKDALRHPQAEVSRLFAQAYAIDPTYFFSCTGWAICLARQGKTDEASALLKPLSQRTEFHRSEYRSLLSAQMVVARTTGLTEKANAIQRALDDLNHE
jgi:tetratricopeptide (TPR) repeat protein